MSEGDHRSSFPGGQRPEPAEGGKAILASGAPGRYLRSAPAGGLSNGSLVELVRSAGPFGRVRAAFALLVRTARLMVGVHDYGDYLRHMRACHAGTPPMTRAEFHRYCVDARYSGAGGRGGTRCPC